MGQRQPSKRTGYKGIQILNSFGLAAWAWCLLQLFCAAVAAVAKCLQTSVLFFGLVHFYFLSELVIKGTLIWISFGLAVWAWYLLQLFCAAVAAVTKGVNASALFFGLAPFYFLDKLVVKGTLILNFVGLAVWAWRLLRLFCAAVALAAKCLQTSVLFLGLALFYFLGELVVKGTLILNFVGLAVWAWYLLQLFCAAVALAAKEVNASALFLGLAPFYFLGGLVSKAIRITIKPFAFYEFWITCKGFISGYNNEEVEIKRRKRGKACAR